MIDMYGNTTHLATILALLCLPLCPIYTQHNLMLHHFSGIPQASLTNPGLLPDSSLLIGLPIVSQINFGVSNNGFRFKDVGAKGWNFRDMELDYEQLSTLLKEDNRLIFDASIPLFSVGLKYKSAYFALAAREIVTGGFRYNRDAIQLGAAVEQGQFSAGQQFRLNELSYQFSHYRDWSATVAHQLNRVTMGIRLHYLSGRENQVSGGTGLVATVNDEGDGLLFNGMLSLLSAGRPTFLGKAPYRFGGTGNNGFAVDLGGTYFVNPQLSLSASIINLGGINWRRSTKRQIIMSPIGEPNLAINQIIDNAVTESSADSINYRSSLPSTAYLGGSYQIDDKSQAKVLLSPRLGGNNIPSLGFSLAYYRHMKEGLEMALAYSIINQRYLNVGLGLNYTKGAIQLYLLSDNVLSFFSPSSQYNANIQSGINLLLNGNHVTNRQKKASKLVPKVAPTPIQKNASPPSIVEEKNPYLKLSGTITTSTGNPLPAYFHLDVYLIDNKGNKDLVRTGRQQGMHYTTYIKRGFEHLLVFHLDDFPYFELSISKEETIVSANSINIDVSLNRHTKVDPIPAIDLLSPQIEVPNDTKLLPADWVSSINELSIPSEEPKPVLVSQTPYINTDKSFIVPLFEDFGGQGNILLEIKDVEKIKVLEQTTSEWWMISYKNEIGWIEAKKIFFD